MKFEDLGVWKRLSQLSVEIYKELTTLKDYGFKDQITRSGLSILSNIAEGFGRVGNKETCNLLNYSKGSCADLRTQIYISIKIGYISLSIGKSWIAETWEISNINWLNEIFI